MSTKKMNFI